MTSKRSKKEAFRAKLYFSFLITIILIYCGLRIEIEYKRCQLENRICTFVKTNNIDCSKVDIINTIHKTSYLVSVHLKNKKHLIAFVKSTNDPNTFSFEVLE